MRFPSNEIRGLFTFNNFVVGVWSKSQTHASQMNPKKWKSSSLWMEKLGWTRRVFNGMKAIVKLNHYPIEIAVNVFPKIARSIRLIEGLKWFDKLPYSCHSNPITDQSIPDCGRLCPFHEHFVVGLQKLHFLHGNVIFKWIFHFGQQKKFFSFNVRLINWISCFNATWIHSVFFQLSATTFCRPYATRWAHKTIRIMFDFN